MSNLAKRLERVERHTSTEATSEAAEMLVTVLGRRDALFWPWRTCDLFRGEIRARERDYLAGTIGVSAKAEGKENWKGAHFSRNELIERGLVTAIYSSGQVTGLRLTLQGEADARALVGLPGIMPFILERLKQAVGFEWGGCRYVSESAFWNTDLTGDPTEFQHLTEAFLPLLTCGAVQAKTDAWGIIYYTDFSLADCPPELPPIVVSELSEVPGLHSRYIAAFNAERRSLMRLRNDSGEIVMPLPCTLDPWRHALAQKQLDEKAAAEAATNGG